MYIRILIGTLIAANSLVAGATDSPRQSPDPLGDTVYITDIGATEVRQILALRVRTAPQIDLPAEIDFVCTVVSTGEYDGIELTLSIQPSGAPIMYEGGLRVDLKPGETEVILQWLAPAELANGKYDVRVTAQRPNGTHMASTRLRLLKLSHALVSDLVTRTVKKVGDLDRHVSALSKEMSSTVALQQMAVTQETVRVAEEAWQAGDFPTAYKRAQEAIDATETVRAGLTFASLAPERLATSPGIKPRKVAIRNGVLESGSAPVFLYGVRLSLPQVKHIAAIQRFGLNTVVLNLSPADVLPSADTTTDLETTLAPFLEECESLRIAVALQLQPQKMAGWALDTWPDMARSQFAPFFYDVTHPRALDVLEKFYRAIGSYVDNERRIFAVSVADVPRFRIGDEAMRQGFAARLHQFYDSDVAMNLAWQTRLRSIDDIPIRWDWDKRAYQAHLQQYHRDQVTGFFSWITNAFGPNPRQIPLALTAPGSTFTIGSAKDGIDLELLNRTFEGSGTTSAPDGPPSGYAMPFPDAHMQSSVLHSLNPTKPVLQFDATIERGAAETVGHFNFPYRERARIWQSAMAGVGMSVTPIAKLFDITEDEVVPHDTRDLAGLVSGGQTLNRLSSIVQQFQKQPAPVAILWSDASRILDSGSPYLPSLRRAYEGAACFGLPLRFISERQLAAGELSSVTILVLPEVLALADDAFDALDRWVEEGGRLVSTGTSIPYNEYGGSRPLRLRASPLTKLVRGAENAGNYLLALDAAFEASSLEEFPRAIDEREYPILGVFSRYLENDEGRYLYLLNLNSEAKNIHLPVGRIEGRDLIEGRPVQFPLELEPLDPMLIALTSPESTNVEATTDGAVSSDPPTATIEPVNRDD